MAKKQCTIYEHSNLGVLLLIQPIINGLLKEGYEVFVPVQGRGLSAVRKHIVKDGLNWVSREEDFPFKEIYGQPSVVRKRGSFYLPLQESNKDNATLISKHYIAGIDISNWHESVGFVRDRKAEHELMDLCRVIPNDYIIVNGVDDDPEFKFHNVVRPEPIDKFSVYDWVGLIQGAKAIYTVQSSFSCVVDLYARTHNLYMYPHLEDPFYASTNLTHRNSNWIYKI